MNFGKLNNHGFGAKRKPHEPLMTASDLGRMKGFSRGHLSKKLAVSDLSYTVIRRKKYFKQSELLKWFDKQNFTKTD